MRQYITGKAGLTRLLTVVLTTSLLTVLSCADELEKTSANHNLTLSTRAGETAAQQIPSMRLFNFNHGGSDDKKFYQEVLNITRSTDKLTAQVEVGQWNMALVSNPNGGTIIKPVANKVISQTPLYKYEPTYPNGGKTTDAHEMYLDNQVTPNITSGGSHTMNAQLNRTVARVDLIIKKTTPNFNLSGTHKIKLHNVPSTISYTGDLLPNAATPDTLSRALESPVTLVNANDGSYKGSETITFIIPAHRGDAYTSLSPSDIVGVKMDVTLNLERTGGTRFAKQEQIEVVAQCNKILRVEITVNDGITFDTSILDWEGVSVNSTVGKGYQNWLYVKKGATGNGLSWSDALPDINMAIEKAVALKTTKTVHGILVAGGSQYVYDGLTVPEGIRVFGGWDATPGTELPSTDVNAPYTSTDRKLKEYKANINPTNSGVNNVKLLGNGAVLDGFIVNGSATSVNGLVQVAAGSILNAVEIKNATSTSSGALTMTGGLASNILIAGNAKGVSMTAGTLLNATVVNNITASEFSPTADIYNSVFWKSSVGSISGTANYSAFEGTLNSIPTGTGNLHLHNTNTQWFAVGSPTPGPHFNLGSDNTRPDYMALSNRSPILGYGMKSVFDAHANFFPVGHAKDIDGNPRYWRTDPELTTNMDLGCYEDNSTRPGFMLRWATEKVYVSSKGGYESQVPLMIPNNDIHNIGIRWTATVQGAMQYTNFEGPATDTGSDVKVGTLNFKNPGSTPAQDYGGSTERQCGLIKLSAPDLGEYLPDGDLKVFQTPGNSSKWTTAYVGSFHRNKERGARYISASNTGKWSAQIISGLDWIMIDTNAKDYGEDIKDTDEGKTPSGGYYKEVVPVWSGGVSGDGPIKFRVGMRTKNDTGAPRYGLIVITRTSGVALFFVRQGEDPDYVYRVGDDRPSYGARTAASVVRFSPYNITDPQGRESNTGIEFGVGGGTHTKYPTQIGYYFKWNQTLGHLYGKATSLAAYSPTGNITSWSNAREVCPQHYRQPTHMEYINSVYYDVADTQNGNVSPTDDKSKRNFEWGAYADGWYDQLADDPVSTSTPYATDSHAWKDNGDVRYRAGKGTLMVSHYNYAAVFFPAGSVMTTSGSLQTGNYYSGFALYFTSTFRSGSSGNVQYGGTHIHYSNNHIGMNCTPPLINRAVPVRCVYVGP